MLLCGVVLFSIAARPLGLYAGGATDIAGYVMAASTFMALAYALRSGSHIRVTLLADRIEGTPRRVLEVACLAVMTGLTGFLALYLARLAWDSWRFGERSSGADAVLLAIPQTPAALGAALFAVAAAHTLLEAALGARPPRPAGRDPA